MNKSNWPEPRIYVACLASYNAGTLHGEWIDATESVEDIRLRVREMLKGSPEPMAEEFAVHDYEGFEPLKLSEYESLDRVAKIGAFINEHGRVGAEVLDYAGDLADAEELLSDRYAGEFDDLASFAEHLWEEYGNLEMIPEHLRRYIDFEAVSRDLELGGEIFYVRIDRQVHVFWTR